MIPSLTNPVVSIVVRVYNAKAYLDACMDRLLTRDCEHIELIAVNDGAACGSGQLLAQVTLREYLHR